MKETWVWSLGQEDPLEEGMATHSIFLPGKSHGQSSLAGYSPRVAKSWTWLKQLSIQFSSVQSLSCVRLFVTPWIAACQDSLSITNSRSSLRLTSIESVMPSSHLILGRPLLLLPPVLPRIKVFSNESALVGYYSGLGNASICEKGIMILHHRFIREMN